MAEIWGEGGNQSLISQYLNGVIPLNYRAVLRFSGIFGCNPSDIRSDLPEQRMSAQTDDLTVWDDIRGFAQAVGMGAGAEAQEYAETHKLKFRADSLRRQGLLPQNLCVYYAKGDSMEPRIKTGDAVLFDISDTTPVDGALFIVQLGPEIHVKRCEVLEDDVYFRSDNPTGDHSWRKPKKLANKRHPIDIVGRVRWIGSWES